MDKCSTYIVYRRQVHVAVVKSGCTQHECGFDRSIEAVAVNVLLELTIAGVTDKVTDAVDGCTNAILHSLAYLLLRFELTFGIWVLKSLTAIEIILSWNVQFRIVNRIAHDIAQSGYEMEMNLWAFLRHVEQTFCSEYVDFLEVVALAIMSNIGTAMDDCVDTLLHSNHFFM